MAVLTVRNLDENLQTQLRIKAASNGCSMEEQVRRILRHALLPASPAKGIGSRLQQRIKTVAGGGDIGDVEIVVPPRSMPRPPPDFGPKGE